MRLQGLIDRLEGDALLVDALLHGGLDEPALLRRDVLRVRRALNGMQFPIHALELVVERHLEVEGLCASEAHREDGEALLVHHDDGRRSSRAFAGGDLLLDFDEVLGEFRLLGDDLADCSQDVVVPLVEVLGDDSAGRDGAAFQDREGFFADELRHFCLLVGFKILTPVSQAGG